MSNSAVNCSTLPENVEELHQYLFCRKLEVLPLLLINRVGATLPRAFEWSLGNNVSHLHIHKASATNPASHLFSAPASHSTKRSFVHLILTGWALCVSLQSWKAITAHLVVCFLGRTWWLICSWLHWKQRQNVHSACSPSQGLNFSSTPIAIDNGV